MEFVNVEKFENWVKETVKEYNGNLDCYLQDVESQYCSSGCSSYELSHFETKSKNPELYDFNVEIIEIDDDEFKTKIIWEVFKNYGEIQQTRL